MSMNIEELIKNRKDFVDAQIKNGFDLTTVLVGLYSDASHFVYEILQNAEDARATRIKFILFRDKLIISHNGIPFSPEDIEAITGISNIQNDKKRDLEKIGKFGIGFKSVYAVTESPKIQSGKYEFDIINFVLPSNFRANQNFEETKITLQFNSKKVTPEETYELIKTKFENFEVYNLLFLTNLQSILLQWGEEKREYKKQEKRIQKSQIAFNTSISVGKDKYDHYIFKRDVQNNLFSKLKNKPKIAIAFKKEMNGNEELIVKANSSNLFAFFETGYETFLNFLLQAPFSTTPSRDNIDFKLDINKHLLDELCELMVSVLQYFRESKKMTIHLLNLLPIKRNFDTTKIVYQKVFTAVKNELISGKNYLPSMFKNQFQAANDLAIVRGKELTSVINKASDMQMLFGIKYWMDTNITVDRTPELIHYLKEELNIKEYTPEDFAKQITNQFLILKDDNWIRRFYEFLNGRQESLWRSGKGKEEGPLRKKPIIRLTDGSQMNPFDAEGNPQVYLPTANQHLDYPTISRKALQSKGSLEFIKKLGIKEPDLFDKVKHHIIPLYREVSIYPTLDNHVEHVNLILDVYDNANEITKAEIVKLFNNTELRFFLAKDSKTGEKLFQNYKNVYLPNPPLKQYFRFSDNIKFICTETYGDFPEARFIDFIKKCGLKDYPWCIEFEPDLPNEKLVQLRKNGNYGDSRKSFWDKEKISDHKLDGLEEIILQTNISIEDSKLIWDIILKCIRYESNKRLLFAGEYQWYYYTSHFITFKSSILTTLQNTSWLYSETGTLHKPGELLFSNLSKAYEQNTDEARYLINQLQFKTEAEHQLIEQMPEERRDQFNQFEEALKLCNEKGIDLISALNQLMNDANREKEKQEIEEAPEVETVDVEEEPFEGLDDSGVEATEIGDDSDGDGSGNENDEKKKRSKGNKGLSQEMKNELGARGEIIALSFLRKKWKEKATLLIENENEMIFQDKEGHKFTITLLNKEGKKGIGCDIIIKNEELIHEYIEVKSTKLTDKDLFPVNGYQWSLAQKVFKAGEGNKYFFYIIKDVLGEKPKVTPIKNPIKKWKDGELRAHPVNLEL